MEKVLRADLTRSTELDLDALVAGDDEGKAGEGPAARSRAARGRQPIAVSPGRSA